MMKKIISLSLCVITLLSVLASCGTKIDENNKGAYISMYISEPVYNFDPARAYNNESALKVISLMFDNLFILDKNGNVKKSLAKNYEIIEDEKNGEYKMIITLHDTAWSDGVALTGNDVVFAWKRILDPSNAFDAASLLFDIKNAKEAKNGLKGYSIDDVGISAPSAKEVVIEFNGKIDYDAFLRKITSYALVPLRENIVAQVDSDYDWAKRPTLFAASGAFKLREAVYEADAAGLILERNDRYKRNLEKDDLDKAVTPYRLIVDYTMTDEEIMKAYADGKLFYIGDIPLSVRGDWADEADVAKKSFSTHTYVLNQNAEINGEKLFANPVVRQALSLAINRQAIVDTVKFAEIATGLIPTGVFNAGSKKTSFRDASETLVTTNSAEADSLLKGAGITASDYSFSISVAAYDDVHMAIAEQVKADWCALGFKVTINAIDVVDNTDKDNTREIIPGIKDDVFAEKYDAGDFEVAAIDYTAYSVDAFSMLAPFAWSFNGGIATSNTEHKFEIPTHICGYNDIALTKQISTNEELEDVISSAADSAFTKLIYNAYKETDLNKRAEILHKAEEKLIKEDMVVIPIIFNKSASLTSKELTREKFTYFSTPIFNKLNLKNYEDHIPGEETQPAESN